MATFGLRLPQRARWVVGLMAALAVVAAVTVPAASAVAREQDSTSRDLVPVRVMHRIVSRPGGLYNESTGKPFVARGANHVRLAKDAAGVVYHSTFEPGKYNQAQVNAFLDQMRHDGYNTVRVFIDPGSNGGDHGIGRGLGTYDKVYGPYMDNVAAFVSAAADRGIYTMPSLDVFPINSYYYDLVARVNGGSAPNMAGRNLSYMDRGRVAAKAEYVANFATALINRLESGHRAAILAYQSDNEVYFEANKAPFHRMSGTVTPVNGLTYDMSVSAERQQAADASLAEYTIRVKAKLADVDPDALLAVGFFSYQAVGKQGPDGFAVHCDTNCSSRDYRYPGRAGILSYWGKIDLLDIHMYTHHGAPVLNAHEMQYRKDPYIVGEFGAYKPHFNNDIIKAAYAMRDLQREACALDAKGYLFFAWDTYEPLASLDKFFQMAEQRGAINGQLAPIVRPDPCR